MKLLNRILIYCLTNRFVMRIGLWAMVGLWFVFKAFGVRPPFGKHLMKLMVEMQNEEMD